MTDQASPQFSDDDLFLRDADRDRMELAYSALLAKRQSLMLASDNDVLLEHYGKILVQQLRRHDDVQVEVYFPSSSEALIQRFNDVLAPMSLEDAVSTHGPSLPARILVLHDARSVQASQLELLARLVNDFPGANVRVVLLVNTQSQLEKDLTAFGKRISRWTIESPDAQGCDDFLRKAALAGLENPAAVLLERLNLTGQEPELLLDDSVDLSDRDPAAEQALLQAVAQHANAVGAEPAKRRRGGKWLLVGAVLLLALSAGAVVMLSDKYRQASSQALQSWLDQLQALVPGTGAGVDSRVPLDAQIGGEVGAEPSAEAGESAIDEAASFPVAALETTDDQPVQVGQDDLTERIAAALNADQQEQAATVAQDPQRDGVRTDLPIESTQRSEQAPAGETPPASSQLEAEALPAAAPGAPTPAGEPTADPSADVPVDASQLPAGNAWVQRLPATNWLVQYVSVLEQGQAEQWIADRPALTGLYALAMVKRGSKQRHYVVVQGPHNTQARAQAFASRAESPKEHWIRTARSVRGDMVQP